MFRFNHKRILPVFLRTGMTVAELARKAGVSHASAQRAVEGEKVSAPIIAKIADTLGVDAVKFLERNKMLNKKTATITLDDGTTEDFEISEDDLAQYFSQKAVQ